MMAKLRICEFGEVYFEGHLTPEEMAAEFFPIWIRYLDDEGKPVINPQRWHRDSAPWDYCEETDDGAVAVMMYQGGGE